MPIALYCWYTHVQYMRSNCTRGRHSESAGVCVLIVCQHTIVCACRVLVNSVLLLLFMLYVRVFRSLEYHVCTSINVITINAHTGTYVCTYSTYVHNVYSMFCVCLHILLFFVFFFVLCTVLPNPPEEVQA